MERVLAVCRASAVSALPVTSPVRLPVIVPEKVALPPKTSCPKVIPAFVELSLIVLALSEPVAVTELRLISESRATDTPLAAAVVVTLEPPEMVRSSVASEISSEPESPSTVSVVTMLAVEVPVIRPLASIVSTGTAVELPIVPAATPESASLAALRVPEEMLDAFKLVRLAPEPFVSRSVPLVFGSTTVAFPE